MALRQQAAVEFIATYSFAIFIISLMLVAATAISLSLNSSTAPIYSSCSIQPLIYCQQSLLTYNSVGGYLTFILVFRNNLGLNLQFPPNAINLTTTGVLIGASPYAKGGCSPTLAAQGSQVICIATISGKTQLKQGSNTYAQFRLTYGLCANQSVSTCTSNTYSATGYSFQTLSPQFDNQYASLYNISISSPNGIVVIGGLPYFNGTSVYLASGTYTLYAQPSVGHSFAGWNGLGAAGITTTNTQNTILTLTNTLILNGNVIANFH